MGKKVLFLAFLHVGVNQGPVLAHCLCFVYTPFLHCLPGLGFHRTPKHTIEGGYFPQTCCTGSLTYNVQWHFPIAKTKSPRATLTPFCFFCHLIHKPPDNSVNLPSNTPSILPFLTTFTAATIFLDSKIS